LQTAIELVVREKRASVSLVQRHLRVGYNRASNLIAAMEAAGVVGEVTAGSNERKVLRTKV
jgi:S-DNA-T family DNA segregation ATPase FtsK/SpoIIIE